MSYWTVFGFLDIERLIFDQSTSGTNVEARKHRCNCSFALFCFYGNYAKISKQPASWQMKYECANRSFTIAFRWNYFINHLHVSSMQTLEPIITKLFMNESKKNLLQGFPSENYVSQKHLPGL